jgi:hypothetical protein
MNMDTNPKILVRFLERQFFLDPMTGTVSGYEPAVITTEEGKRIGHVIDVEKLSKAQYLDFLSFETQLDLVEQKTDLSEILEKDENGAKWLESFKRYFKETFDANIPMILLVKSLPFTPLEYEKFPNDYSKRGRDYRVPRGILDSLSNAVKYVRILPPMKFENDKYIPNIYYNRKVIRSDGIIEDYFINEVGDRSGISAKGVLLGYLKESDIKKTEGDFEGGFPFGHFLSLTYSVSLRQAHKYNPLTISIHLAQ